MRSTATCIVSCGACIELADRDMWMEMNDLDNVVDWCRKCEHSQAFEDFVSKIYRMFSRIKIAFIYKSR